MINTLCLDENYSTIRMVLKDPVVIVNEVKQSIKSYKDLIIFVEDRIGHDRRYAIDGTKIESTLGWKADENFEIGIVKTIDWYYEKIFKDMKNN